jgi:hypothetical protein
VDKIIYRNYFDFIRCCSENAAKLMSWSGKPAFQYTTCPVFRYNASPARRTKTFVGLRVSATPGAIFKSRPELQNTFPKTIL